MNTFDQDAIAALVARLRAGDEAALAPLIQATERSAFRLARSLLHDDDRCHDVLQDVYLTVYREIGQLRDVKAFRAWFSRIVVNRCRRVLREKTPQSLDVLMETGQGPAVAGEQTRVEDREDLKRALAALTDIDRSVLMLREVMDMSYDEIAATLEVPVGTVRSRLSEARRRLVDAWHGGRRGPTVRKTTTTTASTETHLRPRLQRAIEVPRALAGGWARFTWMLRVCFGARRLEAA